MRNRRKITKLLALVLSLLMLFTMIPLSVSAEDKTILQVAQTDDNVNYYLTGPVTVTATVTEEFTGTLNGNGYTVTTSVPLFKTVSGATVENLTIDGEVTGYAALASLVTGTNKTTFKNVTNNASVTNAQNLTSGAWTGISSNYITAAGLTSFVYNTSADFINCTNTGNIETAEGSTSTPAGGIIGYASGSTLTIENCINTGNISSGTNIAAGIVGMLNGTDTTIAQCTNRGEIESAKYAAGIVGYMKAASKVSITSCGNEAKIEGTESLGGIVAYSLQTAVELSIYYCYNTGDILGDTTCVAGIVGRMAYSATKVEGCYNNGNITGTQIGQLYWGTTSDTDIGNNYYNSDISVDAYYSYTEKGGTINATSFKSNELASGKLAFDMNAAIGKTVYYQNINDGGATNDNYPVTDANHGYVFKNGEKLYSLSFYTLKTASVRLNKDGVSGLRFSTAVNKADYAVLTKAEISLDFGTLITPNDYLTDPAKANNVFTADALNEGNYLDVNSTVTGTDVFNSDLKGADMEHDKYYYFCGSITDIKEANYDWDYSAIGYVTINDDIVYSGQYATRSIAYVANAAYYDRSDTPNDTYKYAIPANSEYAIGEVASYSPYNPDAKDGAESELKTIRGYLLQD